MKKSEFRETCEQILEVRQARMKVLDKAKARAKSIMDQAATDTEALRLKEERMIAQIEPYLDSKINLNLGSILKVDVRKPINRKDVLTYIKEHWGLIAARKFDAYFNESSKNIRITLTK